ncbi:kelch repeat-containing protein [Streptomyces sp. NPDC029216]|uniref:Kelch repeat-containing protein n=1 Tax=Streptomyces sp. NPDC029216 TaxID=3154701 RepID=UPI0033CCB3D3
MSVPLLALTTTSASAQGAWLKVPDLPTARFALAGASAPCPKDVEGLKGTCVYAIGGRNDASPSLGTVQAYSPATNTWRTLPDLPTPRSAVAGATAPCPEDVEGLEGTCVYAVGGRTTDAVDAVEAYSPATNTWRKLPGLPTARRFAAAATAPCPQGVEGLRGLCVYAVGGSFSTTVEAYSPATNTWRALPPLSISRDAPGAAAAPCPQGVEGLRGLCVYAVGGFDLGSGSVLDTAEAYSPATNTWRPVASLGSPRVALAASAAPCQTTDTRHPKKSCVYAVAGFNFTALTLKTAEVFSPAANSWKPLPELSTARFELASATAPCPRSTRSPKHTCVYAIAGAGLTPDEERTALSSVEAFPVTG